MATLLFGRLGMFSEKVGINAMNTLRFYKLLLHGQWPNR
jgi:hypothetical protein